MVKHGICKDWVHCGEKFPEISKKLNPFESSNQIAYFSDCLLWKSESHIDSVTVENWGITIFKDFIFHPDSHLPFSPSQYYFHACLSPSRDLLFFIDLTWTERHNGVPLLRLSNLYWQDLGGEKRGLNRKASTENKKHPREKHKFFVSPSHY